MNSCSSILNSSRRRHALADDAVEIQVYETQVRYTYQSYWNVFLLGSAGGGWEPIDLRLFYSLLMCNGV